VVRVGKVVAQADDGVISTFAEVEGVVGIKAVSAHKADHSGA